MSFRLRQLALAALTANAVRPQRNPFVGPVSFPAGWLTGELAPHLLAALTVDSAIELTRRRGRADKLGIALALGSAAGLGLILRQSHAARAVLDRALEDGLGIAYAEQLDAQPTPAELAIPWRTLARPFKVFHGTAPGVRVVRDIAFTEFGRRGHLDLYLPEVRGTEPAPVLLQVHGGGWVLGRKDQQGLPLMRHLAAKGWICVAINYRLAPRDRFPAQIIDVKHAINWVRTHIADYGGDPDYLAITGGSAGGHLAALAALTPGDAAYQPGFEGADTSVQCAVPFYGVYDFAGASGLRSAELMRDLFLAPRVVGKAFADATEEFEAASPLLRITPDAPDFFVIHGTGDSLVEVEQGRRFVAQLRATSHRKVVYAEVPGAQHAFDVFPSIRSEHVLRAVDRFLHWHWQRYRATRRASRDDLVASGPTR